MNYFGGKGPSLFGYWRGTKILNHIHGYSDENGRWCTSESDIARVAESYFQNLFTTSQPSNLELVIDLVDKVVTPTMNLLLLQPYTLEDVKRALFSMHPSKSPKLDGMSPFFFQKYWHTVGNNVTNVVLSMLHSGNFLQKMNHTHIVFIPKINEPKSISNYCPISLGNIGSRIGCKVLLLFFIIREEIYFVLLITQDCI